MKIGSRLWELYFKRIIPLLFPNHCCGCGVEIRETDYNCLCEQCAQTLRPIGDKRCIRCGAPLSETSENFYEGFCEQCENFEFAFGENISLFVYDGLAKDLLHLFKFDGRWSLADLFAAKMVQQKKEYIEYHDLVVEVPLTAGRQVKRGFNQSALIAKRISHLCNVDYYRGILVRRGNSPPQSSMHHLSERRLHMSDKFQLKKRYGDLIRGNRILLIDDVCTTGTTASACAEVLLSNGAREVNLFTLCRAVKGNA